MEAAGVLLFARETGRVLLAQRSPIVPEPLAWASWGGKCEPGEEPATAAVRELFEEAGYAEPVELVLLTSLRRPETSVLFHSFLGLVDEEFTPRLTFETHAARWLPLPASGFPRPLHPGFARMLAHPDAVLRIQRHTGRSVW